MQLEINSTVSLKNIFWGFGLGLLLSTPVWSQTQLDSLMTRKQRLIADPLTPAKAAFYSAIMPGLGQVYLGKAWKLPFVYGAIGASVYYYVFNGDELQRYRTAYKRRIAGYTDDEFIELIPENEKLLEGMRFHQRYRDISFIFIVGTYMLNIIEANVSAHLLQFNVNDQLSIKPHYKLDQFTQQNTLGLTINLKF